MVYTVKVHPIQVTGQGKAAANLFLGLLLQAMPLRNTVLHAASLTLPRTSEDALDSSPGIKWFSKDPLAFFTAEEHLETNMNAVSDISKERQKIQL